MGDAITENLKQKLSDLYELIFFDLKIGGEVFHLSSIKNVDDLYEALIAKGPEHEDVIDEKIPYWADLWHSAIGMAEYILEGDSIKANDKVLEIGCGLGLAGLAAGKKGGEVVLTDYIPEALEVAELVWRMNMTSEPNLEVLDWRNPHLDWKADVLLASDVAYEERNFAPLIAAFQTLVKPGGKIIISEPGRPLGKDFLNLMKPFIMANKVITVPFKGILTKVNVVEMRVKG